MRVVLTYRQDLLLPAHCYPEATRPLAVACSCFGTASASSVFPFPPVLKLCHTCPQEEKYWPPLVIFRDLSVTVCKNNSVRQGIFLQAI